MNVATMPSRNGVARRSRVAARDLRVGAFGGSPPGSGGAAAEPGGPAGTGAFASHGHVPTGPPGAAAGGGSSRSVIGSTDSVDRSERGNVPRSQAPPRMLDPKPDSRLRAVRCLGAGASRP